MLQTLDFEGNAGQPEKRTADLAGHHAALAQLGQKKIDAEHGQSEDGEGHCAVGKVGEMENCVGPRMLHFCDLVLLMLILNCTVILVTPTYKHPSHTEDC